MIDLIQGWIWTLWAALLLIWVIAAFTSKRSTAKQTKGSRYIQLGIEIFAFFLMFDGWFDQSWLAMRVVPRTQAIVLAGLAATLAGMAFCYWARAILGRNWSANVTLKQEHQLVRRGPYSFVRHPIYTGLLFALLGTAFVYGHARSFIAVLLAGFGWWLKLRVEEQFMLQQFGEQYARYRREVRALVPFVL